MISTKEQVLTTVADLGETQLKQVAEYLEFLKFRQRREVEPNIDETELAALYAEFANEDRELAENGLAEYAENLEREDSAR